MIHYALSCEAGHHFEGWFRNSSDFEGQVQRRLVSCPACGSTDVRKQLMAPAVAKTRAPQGSSSKGEKETVASGTEAARANAATISGADLEIVEKLRALKKEVLSKADYVGAAFPEEARKIHYGETEKRGIYGEASRDAVRELAEEGISVLPLPALPEEHN